MTATLALASNDAALVGRIPVRNLWLLFLYASDLAQFEGRMDVGLLNEAAEIEDLIAALLAKAVEHRLHRNLSRSYQPRRDDLTRMRGRIDLRETETRRLLERGQIACRFRVLSVDTPRNRLVRTALAAMAGAVRDRTLGRRCLALASALERSGVSRRAPTPAELAVDVIGRNEVDDRLMAALARLALDLVLPDERAGRSPLPRPARDEVAARKLFERAVGGFYRSELHGRDGWKVRQGRRLHWSIDEASAGAVAILPTMTADIELDNPGGGLRLVIDTKFTHLLTGGWYRDRSVRSHYLYQIYAYLRSQTGRDDLSARAEGLLLHPCVGAEVDETATIQGHRIRFATVDLSASATVIRTRLRSLVPSAQEKSPTQAPG